MFDRAARLKGFWLLCILALMASSCSARKASGPAADHRPLNDQSAAFNTAGQYEQALAAAEQAIEAKPDYSFAWNNKAIALMGLGRNDEALQAVTKAIDLRPDNTLAWSNKGVILRALNRLPEAIAATDRALQQDPGNAVVWFNKACYLAMIGRRDAALGSLATALELEPGLRASAQREPELMTLWNDPAFNKLVK